MATFVTSDAHGHLRALDRALELAAPGAHDTVYVLGDMVDRGPDPVGVLRLVRDLPGARVLMGNHERMMLDALTSSDEVEIFTWEINGGATTAAGLDALPREEYVELLDWIATMPLSEVVEVGGRTYILAHAGIDASALQGHLALSGFTQQTGYGQVPYRLLRAAVAAQDPENLLWARGLFWGRPTGLVGPDGLGPLVIAGHTPSILLKRYADKAGGPILDGRDRACMVEVGACFDTFGVPDRIDIDCSAAAGYPHGRVGVMRLDDRRVWYADIEQDE